MPEILSADGNGGGNPPKSAADDDRARSETADGCGADDRSKIGGQALIEGVMMRGAEKVSWAVRRPDGGIVVESVPFLSVTKRVKILGLPLIRGVVGLFESMSIGYRALSRSADIAIESEEAAEAASGMKDVNSADDNNLTAVTLEPESPPPPPEKKKSALGDRILMAVTMLAAMAVAVGAFNYGPLWIARVIGLEDTALLFRLTAGGIRIALLLIYMLLIGLWGETRRLFEYHGAEHKTIKAYEDGKPLTFDAIDPYSTIHPRCGTSFIVLVAICGIFMSTLIDITYKHITGGLPILPVRFGLSLVFLPLLAGVSYEALKLSAKFQHVPIVNFLIMPGLLVQRITTKRPDEKQVEVAVKALEAAL